jgi:hypothetical protein
LSPFFLLLLFDPYITPSSNKDSLFLVLYRICTMITAAAAASGAVVLLEAYQFKNQDFWACLGYVKRAAERRRRRGREKSGNVQVHHLRN